MARGTGRCRAPARRAAPCGTWTQLCRELLACACAACKCITAAPPAPQIRHWRELTEPVTTEERDAIKRVSRGGGFQPVHARVAASTIRCGVMTLEVFKHAGPRALRQGCDGAGRMGGHARWRRTPGQSRRGAHAFCWSTCATSELLAAVHATVACNAHLLTGTHTNHRSTTQTSCCTALERRASC